MKGRQLSLREVLKLGDGCKVWVEELNERYSDWSGIHVRKQDELISEKDETVYEISYLDGLGEDYGLEVYEWIEEPKEIKVSYKSMSDIVYDMAKAICILRGLDLTDDNIEKIIDEYSEVK